MAAEGKLYARIHPDAKQGSTPVRLYDTAGISFIRGGGSYKGWYPLTSDEQADKLRRVYISPGNPNSMRIFQIDTKENVDKIAASEARSRMTPEMQRMDRARDTELADVRKQVAELKGVLGVLGDPALLLRLLKLADLDQASSGAPMTAEAGDRVEKIAAAPPRRPAMDERMLDDEGERCAPAAAQPGQGQNKPAPAPPARPGTQPGKKQDAKQDAKKQDKDAPPPAAARPGAVAPVPASPADALDPSVLLDEEDET